MSGAGDDAPEAERPAVGALEPLREQLEAIADVPLEQRPALLDEANQQLVSALAALEEV